MADEINLAIRRDGMFAKLKEEKLGGVQTKTMKKTASVASSIGGSADERDSVKGESDGEAQPREVKSKSAARDVAFLQASLQDLMGKLKVLKKEKEAVEINANNARQRQIEREEEIIREHQKKQNIMQESFHLSLKQKEAEKLGLQKRIEESEKLREKFMQRGEESDELKDFQNQELGKVKHMLILAQNQVSRLETELASVSTSLLRESQRVEEVERKQRDTEEALQLKTVQLRSLEEKSAEDTGAFTSTLKEFRSEKGVLQTENKRLSELLNQKVAAYSVMEEKLACLEEDYARDKRAAEIYKREAEAGKITGTDEKNQLVEKIQGLESRLSSADLGDDERFQALEKDRQTLERRLVESREQLTEIKTSWSSKIESLEAQISHLNLKQVDDNADLSAKEEEIAQLKASYSVQLEDYLSRLRDADSRHAQLSASSEEQQLKLERRIAQKDAEMEHFRSEAERWQKEAESHRAETENLRLRAEEGRSDAEKLGVRVAELAAEVEESKRSAEKLSESLAVAESSLLEAELMAEEKAKEGRVAEEKEEERRNELAAAKDEAKAEAERSRRDAEEADRLREEVRKLTEEANKISTDRETTLIDEERMIQTLERRLGEGEEKLVALEREKERWKEEKREMEEELNAKSQKIEKLTAPPTTDATTSPSKAALQKEKGEEEELKRLRETRKKYADDLATERKEKDALLLRNAELSQNVNALKSKLATTAAAAAAAAPSPSAAAAATPLRTIDPVAVSASEETVASKAERELSLDPVDASDQRDSSVEEMKKTVADLQTQLAEKNKTVKLQQQRIGDLRKTIQRELKLQTGGTGSNPNGLPAQGIGINYGSSSEDLPGLCADAASSPQTSSAPHNASSSRLQPPSHPDAENGGVGATYPLSNLHPASDVPCSITPNGLPPPSSSAAAVLPNAGPNPTSIIPFSSSFSSSPFLPNAGSSDIDDVIFPAAASGTGEPSVVSFRYLKHVIIRFMISNEYEAQHLVKAVSTLLRFDKEEEKLVTDHLNYKVSWFGSKPSLKKLKSAKVRDVF